MTKKEIKTKLDNIIDKKTRMYSLFMMGEHNDLQTKDIMARIDSELMAFNAVLDALNNNNTMLNCY